MMYLARGFLDLTIDQFEVFEWVEVRGEPLEPPPICSARGPPADWGELVQAHDDRDVFQASADDLPAIDIHSL